MRQMVTCVGTVAVEEQGQSQQQSVAPQGQSQQQQSVAPLDAQPLQSTWTAQACLKVPPTVS